MQNIKIKRADKNTWGIQGYPKSDRNSPQYVYHPVMSVVSTKTINHKNLPGEKTSCNNTGSAWVNFVPVLGIKLTQE